MVCSEARAKHGDGRAARSLFAKAGGLAGCEGACGAGCGGAHGEARALRNTLLVRRPKLPFSRLRRQSFQLAFPLKIYLISSLQGKRRRVWVPQKKSPPKALSRRRTTHTRRSVRREERSADTRRHDESELASVGRRDRDDRHQHCEGRGRGKLSPCEERAGEANFEATTAPRIRASERRNVACGCLPSNSAKPQTGSHQQAACRSGRLPDSFWKGRIQRQPSAYGYPNYQNSKQQTKRGSFFVPLLISQPREFQRA